jgi:hypothetical protein
MRYVVESGTETFVLPVLRVSPVSIIPPMLQTRLHTRDPINRSSRAKRENLFKKDGLWEIGAHSIEKYFLFGV